ncbi:mTERF domain-containing protein [Cephalotus follicularis]|uniref:mTERF domain-containing protein n=1 Tax=Cephalotus follicularis TaxID=3775 RepID=A0A1Q3BT70_CEPFO|nr:mTERF domain-containing protein [Cephalotus follicularis]
MLSKSLQMPTYLVLPSPNNPKLLHQILHLPLKFPLNSHPFPFPFPTHQRILQFQFPKTKTHMASSSNQPDHLIQQKAQEVISAFLHTFGISKEDSDFIASNSPKYVNMLIDSVLDLDEWNSWKGRVTHLGFEEKLIYMAKEKGDNGKVAFFESIGLSLSSAMNVARYLYSESLPALLHKVKFVKEMLFSGSDDKGLIGKYARRMMTDLSIPIDEDVQLVLSFFEKVEARHGGLEKLGSTENSFRYLVESFPRLLLLSVESNLMPMMEFLENIGIPKKQMRIVLLLYPPVIFYDVKEMKAKLLAFKKVGLTDKDVGKMLLKYPWILSTSFHQNYEKILSFFDTEKVPQDSVECAIRSWPHLLGCSTSKLKLMVDQFGDLHVRNKKLGQVIARSPQLLLRKPQEIFQVVSYLEDLGFDRETLGKILARCPEIFGANIDKTLRKKLEFLSGFGVSKVHLPRVIKKYPEILVSDVGRTVLPRMEYLMEIGLSKREIAFMVRRFSPLLGYSIEKVLRPKLEFLVNTMEKPVKEVVDYPRYFSYSLDKKIKPRYWVLKGRNVVCSLKDMLGKNDEDFAAEFMGVGTMILPPSPRQ